MTVKIYNKSKNQLPSYASEYSAGMYLRANLSESVKVYIYSCFYG